MRPSFSGFLSIVHIIHCAQHEEELLALPLDNSRTCNAHPDVILFQFLSPSFGALCMALYEEENNSLGL